MERFVKGDVVVVPFPFSDLSSSKRRPALVIQPFDGEDLLLAQITSQSIRDHYAVLLKEADFLDGSLKQPSNIRPNKLFTCSKNLILLSSSKAPAWELTFEAPASFSKMYVAHSHNTRTGRSALAFPTGWLGTSSTSG
ncbi:type II toxin-antitoxin system PemK/MazF family toxin [Gracilimonas mengyeensis]|uniref:mRNA interferase MazF n=1 Tax=Gracilimonas mengyeensis TaxID=1302730 RepID=A0A521EG29_9BACT|nr:type II toxin-antitoxin system PemK/MazF family toxin [Gracilimonas mengyeensis]SMO82865.1 mRNA interferase MazF [Gracilimonas mengyeensis]